MMSEHYICVQPVTFWWPMRCSNHWAIWTEMTSEDYICVQPVTFCNDHRDALTIELHGLRWWVKVTCVYMCSTCNLSDQRDALTIELHGLRWWNWMSRFYSIFKWQKREYPLQFICNGLTYLIHRKCKRTFKSLANRYFCCHGQYIKHFHMQNIYSLIWRKQNLIYVLKPKSNKPLTHTLAFSFLLLKELTADNWADA